MPASSPRILSRAYDVSEGATQRRTALVSSGSGCGGAFAAFAGAAAGAGAAGLVGAGLAEAGVAALAETGVPEDVLRIDGAEVVLTTIDGGR